MPDLTDKSTELIIIKPDAETMIAIKDWADKTAVDKDRFVIDDAQGMVASYRDATGKLDAQRDDLIALVDVTAKVPTDVVRIRFSGAEVATCGLIVQKVAKLPEGDK